MRNFLICTTAALMLSGCASMPGLQPAVKPSISYSAADHAAWKETGTAVVTGQAFLRQQGGGVVTCAGSPVYLLPKSPYFDELATIIESRRKPDMTGFSADGFPGRSGQCDAQGNFRFENLPEASWYVISEVRWTIGYATQGGELVDTVTTTAGQTTNVLLTDKNR